MFSRAFLFALLLSMFLRVNAQTSALRSFLVIPSKKEVLVQWTVAAGYTCNTTEVEWSVDSLNFQSVYSYPEACGNSTLDLTYTYNHPTPASGKRNYYRLNLGVHGYSNIVGASLNDYRNYKMFPVPFKDKSLISFENPENKFLRLYLFNHSGTLIEISDPFQGNTFTLDRYDLVAGWYYFVISDLANFFIAGKTAVTDL